MKTITIFCATAFTLTSCGHGNKITANYPAPGTVIDSMSEPVATEKGKLNNDTAKVVVAADSSVKDGIYDIHAAYGKNFADGKFAMPKGLNEYAIKLTKSDIPYSYIIGFTLPGDTAYHPYLEVITGASAINIKYLKSYTFE